jgi:hypothetical protein
LSGIIPVVTTGFVTRELGPTHPIGLTESDHLLDCSRHVVRIDESNSRQHQWPQPGFGHREVEENFFGLWGGVKGLGQGILGSVGLLIEELAADAMFPGQVRDCLSPREDLDRQIPPLLGEQSLGRPRREAGHSAAGPRSDCVNVHENVV